MQYMVRNNNVMYLKKKEVFIQHFRPIEIVTAIPCRIAYSASHDFHFATFASRLRWGFRN